jgi:hypothetical protein
LGVIAINPLSATGPAFQTSHLELDQEARMTVPSLRFTIARLVGDMKTTSVQYIWGMNERFESRSCLGHSDPIAPTNVRYEYGPLRAHVLNRDLGYHFEIEPATGTYTAVRAKLSGSLFGAKPWRAVPTSSGRVVDSHIETIDTGERRELFGNVARRVITKTRQTRESEMLGESECDCWYIDAPAAWAKLHPAPRPGTFHLLVATRAGTTAIDDYNFTEVGKRETGFALLLTRTVRSPLRDETGKLTTHESLHREEVTEFSELPLEPAMFVPPLDFKRVPWFPDGSRYVLAYRTRLRWQAMKDSFMLPKRIAEFATSNRGN